MSKFFYALYDLANSAYTMIIITFVTSAYFANQIVGNPQIGAAYWQWTAGLCGISGLHLCPSVSARSARDCLVHFPTCASTIAQISSGTADRWTLEGD